MLVQLKPKANLISKQVKFISKTANFRYAKPESQFHVITPFHQLAKLMHILIYSEINLFDIFASFNVTYQ